MASLAAMLTDVYSLTNRPDLVAETTLAVKAATLKAHQSDFYLKDIFETGIEFSTLEYTQALEYKTIIPRWRALKYIRKYDADAGDEANNEYSNFFTIITPEQAFDSYKYNKTDVVYLAGNQLQIKSSSTFQYALLGCYVNPDTTDNGYSSWIADEHPYVIVFDAARIVFKTIGYDEQSATYEKLVAEQYQELKTQILANGW